jgi:WD40 repeat protein
MNSEEALKIADALLMAEQGKPLSDLQRAILLAAFTSKKRLSYREIAQSYGYSESYLKYDVGPELWRTFSAILQEKVSKSTIRRILERHWERHWQADPLKKFRTAISSAEVTEDAADSIISWGEAVDVSVFYGREQDLTRLESWTLREGCRVVAILGMGGMGKTALSVKLTQSLASHYPWVLWRSLRNAPPLQSLLQDLLQIIAPNHLDERLDTIAETLSVFLNCCQTQRCLIVLDNFEAVLGENSGGGSPAEAGGYRSGYGNYGEFLKTLGEVPHQSCLVLTSREKPQEIAHQEGQNGPVRSHRLLGLEAPHGEALLRATGTFQATPEVWLRLVQAYGGNPLALKMVATSIQDCFGGHIAEFLNQGVVIWGDISTLIAHQVERLTPLELELLYWMAIWQAPVTLSDLNSLLMAPPHQAHLLAAVESLSRRSLVERVYCPGPTASLAAEGAGFTLQPVIVEYLLTTLTQQICRELQTSPAQSGTVDPLPWLDRYGLMLAEAPEPIRNTQSRLIVQPILAQLHQAFGATQRVKAQLDGMLQYLREHPLAPMGYAAGNLINLLNQAHLSLRGYDLSHLTIRQAHLQGIALPEVNLGHSHLQSCTFTKSVGNVQAVTYNPAGSRIATGGADGEITLWRADGTPLLACDGHSGRVWSLAFSPDGKILASGGDDQTIRLWDGQTGACLQTLQGHTNWVFSVAFSPDGTVLASGGDRTLRLWSAKTGECQQVLTGHTHLVRSVKFSPGGQMLASGSDDGTVRLWDVKTCQPYRTLRGHSQRVRTVAFCPKGRWLASGSSDRTLKLWDIRTGTCEHTLTGHGNWIFSATFSPDGSLLASCGSDKTIRLWDMASIGECKTIRGHGNRVWSLAFSPVRESSPDGNRWTLASGGDDLAVKLWSVGADPEDGKPPMEAHRTMQGHASRVYDVAVSPDGKIIASAHSDHAIRLWDGATGQCRQVLQGHSNWVWTVTFSPDGRWLASGGDDQAQPPWWAARIWDGATGTCRHLLPGHQSWVQSVAFSPDSLQLATGSCDHTVRLWEVETGHCQHILEGHSGRLWCVAFSPDGQFLASSSDDQTIRLWEVASGQCLNILRGHQGWVQSVAFSPDGEWLASGSSDRTIRLWQVLTGRCRTVLKGHRGWVRAVAFSPVAELNPARPSLLASGSSDQTVRLWDWQNQTCEAILQGHSNWVRGLAFGPQGNLLVSGSQDETIALWDVTDYRLRQRLRAERLYENLDISGTTGLSPLQKRALKLLGATEQA